MPVGSVGIQLSSGAWIANLAIGNPAVNGSTTLLHSQLRLSPRRADMGNASMEVWEDCLGTWMLGTEIDGTLPVGSLGIPGV